MPTPHKMTCPDVRIVVGGVEPAKEPALGSLLHFVQTFMEKSNVAEGISGQLSIELNPGSDASDDENPTDQSEESPMVVIIYPENEGKTIEFDECFEEFAWFDASEDYTVKNLPGVFMTYEESATISFAGQKFVAGPIIFYAERHDTLCELTLREFIAINDLGDSMIETLKTNTGENIPVFHIN